MPLAPDPSDLTTVANLIGWLSETAPDTDKLQRLITAASTFMQTWMTRTIRSASYVETQDGHGGNRLVLGNAPVTAVSSVVIDGQAIPPSPAFGQAGFTWTSTAIILTGYRFNRGDSNVQVAYTGGFATTPPDLEQACLELCALKWKYRQHADRSSATMGNQTVSFVTGDMPESVRTVLAKYDSVVPV
jgi:hypothetical protein